MELILEVFGWIRSGTYSSTTISSAPQPEIQCHHTSPQRLIAHKSQPITELITTHTPDYQPLHHVLSVRTTTNTLICPKHRTQTPQSRRTLMYLKHRKIRRIMYVQRNIEKRSRNHCYREKPISITLFLGSWFRASFSTYVYKYPTRCKNCILFYNKITLHVSGTIRAHHQEYINCSWQSLVQHMLRWIVNFVF
jgi:hypothetical protein